MIALIDLGTGLVLLAGLLLCFATFVLLVKLERDRPPTKSERREELLQQREEELKDVWSGFDRTREDWGFEAHHTCETTPEHTVEWWGD